MSCEKCKSNEHHTFRREYSRDAKQMGRAMYNMLLNGPPRRRGRFSPCRKRGTPAPTVALWSRKTSGCWCTLTTRMPLMTRRTLCTNPQSAK